MLASTALSLCFSIDGKPVQASCRYAPARPYGDFLTTTLPYLDLHLASTYVGSGEFDYVPALHKIGDVRLGNDVVHGRLAAPEPGGLGAVAQLLYDHLQVLEEAVAERRALTLCVAIEDEDLRELNDARRVLSAAPPPS